MRDGLIQRFEFTYELSYRILYRYLRLLAPSADLYDQMSVQDQIRTGTSRACCAGIGRAAPLPGHACEDQSHLLDGDCGTGGGGNTCSTSCGGGRTMPLPCGTCCARICRREHASLCSDRVPTVARRFSDLDLALERDRPLKFDVISRIADARSQSELPYKVDIVDLATMEPRFRSTHS